MSRFAFRGMMAPTFTPFKKNGSLNLEVIPAYAKCLQEGGVKGIWVNGTVGEGMSMTVEERKSLTEAWVKCRREVSTMIIHCGAGCLMDTQELARHAESQGVDGVAVLPCLYDKPTTTEDLVEYMVEVAKACPNTHLFYYHIPMKTNVNLSMSEFLKKGFKKVPTLAGIKFTDMDVSGEGRKCVEVDSGSLTIFSGFDKTLQEALSVGFSCAVNGGFSFLPQFGSQIFSLMEAGNVSEAKRMQEVLSSHFDVIFKETGKEYTVASLKTATSLLTGVEMGPVRFPVKALSDQKIDNLKNAFKNLGLKVY
ncbi:N-acetylneuraminate lyase-like isoform X1 [Homarus americanus]|uniref:N-acetylneuraminate lyase-like isoform X1 n=1 Tax=Homarus americanus TaxID=6706 RepID=UPI001C468414|nr:N-acetylneuraminate lyase-like isoform X1 [Homarus americanus]